MLINLSSTNETSPSNFTNHFLDNLIIPPKSFISLVRCSIHRNGKITQIKIPAGTTMSFRYTPYDVITPIL